MGPDQAAGASPGRQAAPHLACPGMTLRLELQADPVSVRHVLRLVRTRLAADLSETAASNLELVLAEMLNNIVKHAYRGEGGRIGLQIGAGPDCLLCRVTDQGIAMPGGVLPDRDRLQPGLPVADLPEGGFGWRMIRDLATDLQYRRDAGWNVVKFRMAQS